MKSKLLRLHRLIRCMTGSAWLSLFLIGQLSATQANAMRNSEMDQQESIIVSGKIVSSSDNEGLPGVNVLIKGTVQGTVSDANGEYRIGVPSNQTVLVFSSIGFDSQEVVVGGQTTINVTLVASTTALDEIVVVGYGTQKKLSLTSSVAEVKGGDLTRRPVNTIEQAMQGKMPGLTVVDNGGSPGNANAHIVVRGVSRPYSPVGLGAGDNSTIGDNSPLVIVDGVEQPYSNINPNDIESITVLKDASSTAIYGSRASNGVILITTKRAQPGKLTVNYNGFYALQKSVTHPEHMDIESYLELEKIAYQNKGSAPPASLPQYTDAGRPTYVTGTQQNLLKYPLPYDWYNVMLKTAPQINNTLSVSGGTENFKARMSLRSQDQDGIIANTNSKLAEVRVNTDFQVSPKISFSTDLDYRAQNTLQPHDITNIFRLFMQNAIWAVPQYPDGTYGGGTQGNSPLLLAENGGTNRVKNIYTMANVTGRWEIVKGLTFSTQLAIRTNNMIGKDYVNTWQTKDSTVVKKSNLINSLTESRVYDRQVTVNSLLNYGIDLSGGHSLKFLLGYSQIQHDGDTLRAYRQNFYNNDVQAIGQGINDATKSNSGSGYQWALRSYFGRVNYSFKDKYLFEANARYDGSSKFSPTNQYSFFPSMSAGWRVSQEPFWSGLSSTVSDFKVRASWGKSGNQAIGLYAFSPRLNLVNYSFNGAPAQGYVQQTLSDPNLQWETTKQTDVGLDAEFFNGRLSLTFDYYKKVTDGILLSLPIPATIGLQPGPQNAGIVENKGFEFLVGTRNRIGQFGVNANLNLSINKNQVVDLAGTGPYIYGNDIDPRYITGEGYPVNAFWGYKTGGLFQTDGDASSYPQFMRPAKAGDVKVLDLNNDGTIDPDDMTYLANSFPKYTFGGTVNVTYKAFALNLSLQGAAGVGMRIARALGEQGNYEGFTPDIYTNNYWTPENPSARFPRPTKQDLRNQASTDRMIVDASYLRVKNLQLVYNIPTVLSQKLFMERASVYVSGTNLLTFSKLNEWHLDPESSSGWQNYYPQTSVYTLGVNLQF